MNDNFNNDKWTEKAVWIKKEPLSSDAVLSEVRAELLKIAVCNKHYSRAYLELSEVMRVIDAKISEHLR